MLSIFAIKYRYINRLFCQISERQKSWFLRSDRLRLTWSTKKSTPLRKFRHVPSPVPFLSPPLPPSLQAHLIKILLATVFILSQSHPLSLPLISYNRLLLLLQGCLRLAGILFRVPLFCSASDGATGARLVAAAAALPAVPFHRYVV